MCYANGEVSDLKSQISKRKLWNESIGEHGDIARTRDIILWRVQSPYDPLICGFNLAPTTKKILMKLYFPILCAMQWQDGRGL
jgi:hypothetical protein